MQILWYSKIVITMEIYTKVPPTATREALRKLGQWLGDTPGPDATAALCRCIMARLRIVAQRPVQPDVGQCAVVGLCQATKASSR
jgi:hypothetical protein